MTSPRAMLARAAVLTECIAVRMVSIDLRLSEDADVAAIMRKLTELTTIVNTLAGKSSDG